MAGGGFVLRTWGTVLYLRAVYPEGPDWTGDRFRARVFLTEKEAGAFAARHNLEDDTTIDPAPRPEVVQ